MKRFFASSLLALALFAGGALAAVGPVSVPHAHAQAYAGGFQNAASSSAALAKATPPGCGTSDILCFIKQGTAAIMQTIMQLFAWLLGVSVLLLDDVVYFTVLKMGSYISGLSAVGVTWRILRDIGNIVLIFGFIAVGISVILDSDWYGGGKKLLPTLIIVAVFLNFSLFISEAIIDVGNLFATELYTQINGGQPLQSVNIFSPTAVNNEGISNKVMSQLGFQNIYSIARYHPESLDFGNMISIGFMGSILFMVAAFVFFSLSFILLARFVILILLIVVAPIGFAGLAVPKLGKTAHDWWSMLINQTLTAPILLLLLYVALKVITDTSFLSGFSSVCTNGMGGGQCLGASDAWVATFTTGSQDLTGFGGVILSFLVAMGLLLAVTYMSTKMSAFGGSWATKMGGKLSFGFVATSSSLLGRNTLGFGSARLASTFRKSNFGTTGVGRGVTRFLDARAKSTYDFRNTSSFKTAASPLGRFGLQTGTATKANYVDARKAAIKTHEDYAKSLEQSDADKEAQKKWEKNLDIAQDSFSSSKKNFEQARKDEIADYRKKNDVASLEERRKKIEEKLADSALIPDARAALEKDKADLIKELEAHKAQENQINARHDEQKEELKKAHKEGLEKINEEIAKTKPSYRYAQNISSNRASRIVNALAIGPDPKAAAEKIKKEAKKSKASKDLEAIRKAIEGGEKSGGGEEKKEDKKEESH